MEICFKSHAYSSRPESIKVFRWSPYDMSILDFFYKENLDILICNKIIIPRENEGI